MAAEFLARSLYGLVFLNLKLDDALSRAERATGSDFISSKLADARKKVREAADPGSELAAAEFVDDVAITSLGRLWEVGKSEPIKIGKASPTEGALPAALYLALRFSQRGFLAA